MSHNLITTIGKRFKFDAAHTVPNHPGKCKNIHGHTWSLDVIVSGPRCEDTGMLLDFGDLSGIVNDVINEFLDHKFINDVFPHPTCEVLVEELANIIGVKLRQNSNNIHLTSITIRLQEGLGGWAEVTVPF